jgi:hypothetical protein
VDLPGIEKADVKHHRRSIEEGKGMSARDPEVHPHHTVTDDMPTFEDCDVVSNVAVVSADFEQLPYGPFSLME